MRCPLICELFSSLDNCLRLAGTASMHSADVFARTNAFALRNLRSEWLSKSSLSRDLKERVKKSPLCNGEVPEDKSIEFVAPIVGPSLQSELDLDYTVTKKSEQIRKKSQTFKRPHTQSGNPSHNRGGQRGKRPRFQENNSTQQQQQRPQMRFDTRGRGRGRGRGSGNNNRQQHRQRSKSNSGNQNQQRRRQTP